MLQFIYSGELEEIDMKLDRHQSSDVMMATYCLADKWCVEAVANKVVDRMRRHYQVRYVHIKHISALEDGGLGGSKLQQLMVKEMACLIRSWGWNQYVERYEDKGVFLHHWFEAGGMAIVRVVKALANVKAEDRPSHAENGCKWHMHKSTPACISHEGSGLDVTKKKKRKLA